MCRYKSLSVTKSRVVIFHITGRMKFYGFWFLLFAIFCITIAVGRSIDCTDNAFLKSKSIACYGRRRGGGTGNTGGNTGGSDGGTGSGTNGSDGNGANGTPGAMNPMAMAQQAMGTMMDMMSNMNPMG